MLFEEFLQCSGNWLESSIVINIRSFNSQRRRGVYKYMSREDRCISDIWIRLEFEYLKLCQDLLDKYHGDYDAVDEIIRIKD